MGLDWLPGEKPRPGAEAEYSQLKASLSKWLCLGRKKKQARLGELLVEPWESLGAPLVGRDEGATQWARDNFENRTNRALDMSTWLRNLDGLPVLELVRPCDGLPLYTNGGPGEYVGAESFRAQFLKDCEDVIGQGTYDECFSEMKPQECRAFGERLVAKAVAFASKNGIDLSRVHDAEDPDSPEFRVSVVLAAGRWCIFWGEKGHGMVPWF